MKNTIFFVFLVLLVSSCRKGDEPGNPSVNTGDVIIEQTVSSEDTTLSSDNFSLDIAANTFAAPTVIKVTKTGETPFADNALTPLYFLNDLPVATGKPLEVTLKGIDISQEITVYLAELTYVTSTNSTVVTFRPFGHTESDGKVVVTIPRTPSPGYKSGEVTDETLTVGIVVTRSQQTITSAGGHFRITCPASKASAAAEIADYLEEAYELFKSPPLNFDYSPRTVWPMDVTLLPMDHSIFGEQQSSVWGDNFATLAFNSEKTDNMPEMRITAGHEFFHFVQSLYDMRTGFMKAKFGSDHYWLDEAMSAWSEEMFTSNTGYVSGTRTGNETAPFEGGLNETKQDSRGFGYGMSGIIKYIADHYGKDNFRKIYEQIRLGRKPGEAIRIGLNKPYSLWYGSVIGEYAKGSLYNDVSTGLLVGSKSGEFQAETNADSVRKFQAAFTSLSSRIYVVSMKETALTDQSSFSVTADQQIDQSICIYRFRTANESPELVGNGTNLASVADIKSMTGSGYKFIVVITNLNYSAESAPPDNLSYTFRISDKKLYRAFTLSLNVMCHYTYHYENGSPNQVGGAWNTNGLLEIPVIQNGNVLTANWNGLYAGYNSSGTATITLNDNGTADIILHQDLDVISFRETLDCSLSSIPLKTDDWYASTFSADESFTYIRSLYWKDTYQGFYEEMDDYYLDSQFNGKNVILQLYK